MSGKLRKASSTGVANVATVASPREVAAATLSVNSGGLLNWSTTTSVDFTTYTLVNGVVTNKADWTGTADVDNGLITDMELTNGTDVGNEVGDIVICIATAAWTNDVIDTLLTVFDQTGNMKADAVASSAIVASAISTVKLADSSVTADKIVTGAVTTSKMDADARKQTLDINGSTTIVFSTSSTQPSAQSGKTIIWFAPS